MPEIEARSHFLFPAAKRTYNGVNSAFELDGISLSDLAKVLVYIGPFQTFSQ
jgi:hypothetical protein